MASKTYQWRPAYRSFLQEWFLLLAAVPLAGAPVFLEQTQFLDVVTIASLHRLLTIGVSYVPFLAGLLALYAILTIAYYRLSRVYRASDGEVTARYGLIARDVDRIRLQDIRSTSFNQSIVGRIFRFGDAEFASASTGEPEVRYLGIPNPKGIESHIKELADAAKEEASQPTIPEEGNQQ